MPYVPLALLNSSSSLTACLRVVCCIAVYTGLLFVPQTQHTSASLPWAFPLGCFLCLECWWPDFHALDNFLILCLCLCFLTQHHLQSLPCLRMYLYSTTLIQPLSPCFTSFLDLHSLKWHYLFTGSLFASLTKMDAPWEQTPALACSSLYSQCLEWCLA